MAKKSFQGASDAIAYLRKNSDIDISEQYKSIKIKKPVGLRFLAAIDYLTVQTKDHNYGWIYT